MSEKTESKKEEDLEKRLVDLYPKFLETVREVYPLAVLGSLCVAIAAFTTQTYPAAQPYAITAASLFLIAFAVSFPFKMFPNYYLALISYVSTALAIVFLFLVIGVFMRAIPIVGTSIGAIPDIAIALVYLIGSYFFYRFRKSTKSNIIRSCCTIGVPVTLLIVGYLTVSTLAKFIGFTIPNFMTWIYFSLVAIMIILFLIMALVTKYRDGRKKNKT